MTRFASSYKKYHVATDGRPVVSAETSTILINFIDSGIMMTVTALETVRLDAPPLWWYAWT
jgi:hypothetical protein